ncbi:Carboxypeptidase D [Paragonimus heterotremus]|uniref:Carboxypeptidase D n=1 Tax=Paragonimus heterotremus TaxID=100268 RepID=A0A8J4TJ79_9TREM|nr:Carboxypeptidase D [Paragonimus heterotremus]
MLARKMHLYIFILGLLLRHSDCSHTYGSNVSALILSLIAPYTEYSKNPGWSLLESPTSLRYHHLNELYEKLREIHSKCPDITHLYDIGSSVLGRKLWVLSIGDNPTVHEPGEPEVKLIANIHGNEAVGRELLLRLGTLLCDNYGRHELVTMLLKHTQIHLLPSMNPDGFEVSNEGDVDGLVGRANEHERDLNRNFPDQFYHSLENRIQEPETLAVMNWTLQRPFVLSASLHAGALVTVYPYDGSQNQTAYYHATPDDATFRHLALVYSLAHKHMSSGQVRCHQDSFPLGISNGNQWYPLYGGMQDWNYLHTGCMELTVELGCTKYPRASSLLDYWNDNKYALVVLLAEVHRALRGFVTDVTSARPIGNATIHVLGNSHLVWTTEILGEYWRLLPPTGLFTVWASKTGYFTSSRVVINATELPFVRQTSSEQLNFTLWPDLTSVWSAEIDFDIVPNRLPAYFPESDIAVAVESSVYGDFLTVGELNPSEPRLLGVEVALIGQGVRSGNHSRTWNLDNPIVQVPGRIRVLILAGLHGSDLVSSEMTLRLIRHYAKGLRLFDRTMSHLLSNQVIILPYLDPDGINKNVQKARVHSTGVRETRESADGESEETSQPIDYSKLTAAIRRLVYTFQPHVLLTLETGDWPNHEWVVRGKNISLPISPIYVPSSSVAGVSMTDLMGDLAIQYAMGAHILNRSDETCSHAVSGLITDKNNLRRTQLHNELVDILKHSSGEHGPTNQVLPLPPIALAIRLACITDPVYYMPPQALPELWHQTLTGLDSLLTAIRNLSFRGQLLVESSSLTLNLTATQHPRWFGHDWVPVPTAQLHMQAARFIPSMMDRVFDLDRSDISNVTRWLSVPVDGDTGLFSALLPAGTFLAFSAAGPEKTPLGDSYEEMVVAISTRPDHNNGRTRIRLPRLLAQIQFLTPDDLLAVLHKHADSGMNRSQCGHLDSIGLSRLGKPIYVFTMGREITKLQSNDTSPTSSMNENDLLLSAKLFSNETAPRKPVSAKTVLLGNLHGHDQLTPQLLVHFIDWLCDTRDTYSTVNTMLSSVELAIVPIPNPDGLFHAWKRPSSPEAFMNAFVDPRSEYCDDSAEHAITTGNDPTHNGVFNYASVDLWQELIQLTQSDLNESGRWWWEDDRRANLSVTSLQPETVALIQWLRSYQPAAVFSFPTAVIPAINFGVDPSETQRAQLADAETHRWLQFLGYLSAPGFHRNSSMCRASNFLQSLFRSNMPPDHRRRPTSSMRTSTLLSHVNVTGIAALSLALASISPQLALEELPEQQLQQSASFRPPLPLHAPVSVALSLCSACPVPTPIGVARVWKDFRFPSLLISLIGHATLTVPGSSGLIAEVQGQFNIALPPGTFRFGIRAAGYVDLNELVTIDAIKGPTYHVFRLTPISALSAGARAYLMVVAGSVVACLLSCTTIWFTYRFCCRPRASYALARRSVLSRTSADKFTHPCWDPSRGAYRLLPISPTTKLDGNHSLDDDDARSAMLTHGAEEHDDTAENDGIIAGSVDLQTNYAVQIRGKRSAAKQRTRRQAATKRGGHMALREEDSLEEVDLV